MNAMVRKVRGELAQAIRDVLALRRGARAAKRRAA
jgi:hypothetical protein